MYSLLYENKTEEIHSSLISNEITEESLIQKAGGVNIRTRDSWSLWLEKNSAIGLAQAGQSEGIAKVDPVRKENFNPPRDFKIARLHGQIESSAEPEFCPAFEAFEKDENDKRPYLYESVMD